MKREIFWEAHSDSTSFPSGGRKIYHERSAIGDMLSAIQNMTMRGLGSNESSPYSFMGGKMLSVGDLIDINYIPSESDISLKLLVDFYEEYLCKRIFIFTLRDGQTVKLFFRDATELFHISGIDHIYEGIPMDGSRFIQEIKDGNINLTTVKNVNTAAYKDYEIRIRSMACIDTIIKNCEYLWYPSGKIPGSQIDVKYLLLKGLDEKNLHLGIDTYKINRPYFTRTLLITEGDNAGKFIGKADDRLKVSKLEIRDKDTNQLLILIERELAEQTAFLEVETYSEEWFSKELPILLKNHLVEYAENTILDVFLQYISIEWIQRVSSINENLEIAWNMKDEEAASKEWILILLDVLGDKLTDETFVKHILDVSLDFVEECERLLPGCVHKSDKKSWGLACRKYIEQNKSAIKDKVRMLDFYWVGKIVGEAIRKYEKEELNASLQMHITDYITMEFEDIVTEVLTQKLTEQKEVVLEKISTMLS